MRITKAKKVLNPIFQLKICFIYVFSRDQQTKIDGIFIFDYNDVRAFELFKCTAGCILVWKKQKWG